MRYHVNNIHKGSAPTSGCLYQHSLLYFSDLTPPPLALLRFCLPLSLSLSLSRLRLDARSSAEIHPLSLKFSASWLFRSDKNRGLIRAKIKADWRHSCILPLLHLATLTIPSSFLRPVVWSWMFNRKQSFEGVLFAACTQTRTFSDGRWPILCLHGSEVEAGCFMSRFVWACVRGIEGMMVEVSPGLYFHSCLLSPMITQNAFTPWQPWGLLSLLSHTRGGRAGGDKAEIMGVRVCVCVFVHSVFVCAGKGELGEGKKKSTWPADRAVFSKIHQQEEKKKTRGKNNKPKKTEKQPTSIYPLSAAAKAAAPSVCGKQTRERIRHKLLCCQPLYWIRWLKWH